MAGVKGKLDEYSRHFVCIIITGQYFLAAARNVIVIYSIHVSSIARIKMNCMLTQTKHSKLDHTLYPIMYKWQKSKNRRRRL